ncbi:hypothetical protein [Serinicoccus hydrothermalis]|uniref:hypothetical protein n=1 Tax=Serinicoccus hydrothermalis TaxID=1758689 RepID=UPI000A4A5BA5|nr:hypothetical protein [Serinicoccus hydrothermalis]
MENKQSGQPLSRRAVFLVPAGVAMLAGVNAALMLVGVGAPVEAARMGDLHGMLMVGGFLGTLIAMERAVALRDRLGFAAPLLLGLGGIALLTPLPVSVGKLLLLDGAIAFALVYAALFRRNHDDVVIVELLGAVCLAIGSFLWLQVEIPWLLPWLVGFVVLTICAERVELARLHMPPTGGRTLVLHSAALTITLVMTLLWPDFGARLTGLVIVSLVVWLVRHDVARKTIRATGLPRFSAASLLGGYVWLLLAAVTWVVGGAQLEGDLYDLVVHATMLGFAISMVMAHAPVILPAVLRRPLPYRPIMWIPLVLMHVGLALRILAGDLGELYPLWQVGSVINIVALLLFLVIAIASSVAGPVAHKPRGQAPPGGIKPSGTASTSSKTAPTRSRS